MSLEFDILLLLHLILLDFLMLILQGVRLTERNMINVYLRGELALRVLGGVDSGGVQLLS
jgi:hypothetical protein